MQHGVCVRRCFEIKDIIVSFVINSLCSILNLTDDNIENNVLGVKWCRCFIEIKTYSNKGYILNFSEDKFDNFKSIKINWFCVWFSPNPEENMKGFCISPFLLDYIRWQNMVSGWSIIFCMIKKCLIVCDSYKAYKSNTSK